MKKVVGIFLSLVFLAGAFLVPANVSAVSKAPTPTASPKVEDVNSFDMFWPIVAGKTAGDSFYWLKTLKENIRGALIFSKYKKTDYDTVLGEKRAVELEKLIMVNKDYPNANKTLTMSKELRSNVFSLIKAVADEGTSTTDLKNRFMSSLENQKKLALSMQSKVTDQAAKDILKSYLDSLDSDISSLK